MKRFPLSKYVLCALSASGSAVGWPSLKKASRVCTRETGAGDWYTPFSLYSLQNVFHPKNLKENM